MIVLEPIRMSAEKLCKWDLIRAWTSYERITMLPTMKMSLEAVQREVVEVISLDSKRAPTKICNFLIT